MRYINTMIRACITAGIAIISIIILLFTGQYVQCSVYNFPDPAPFSGRHLFNPYLNDSLPCWSKANFHAHSIAWLHLTNGHQQPDEILHTYAALGYNIASISNYQSMARINAGSVLSVPVYEHGYNASKVHSLVFEPTRISFFDVPFFHTLSMKQSVLDALEKNASCVALNHPRIRNSYTDQDLKKLSGYNLMEVFNHSANSVHKWDIALSAGKPVWCLGNDDMHNSTKPSEVGVCWTMINHVNREKDIVPQLKSGNAYIVHGKRGKAENALQSMQVTGDTMHLALTNIADTIRFIGQNGQIKQVTAHAKTASYTFRENDTYIRTEVVNKQTLIYLNPVIRYDGKNIPVNSGMATVNITGTFFYRCLVLLLGFSLLILLNRKLFLKIFRQFPVANQKRKATAYSLDVD